jgi:hypothetical protein
VISGATNTNYNVSQSGTFTVTATAANCPTLTASPINISVAPKPDAVLSYENDTLFCMPKGMPKYGWMIDDQYIDGENKDYIIVQRPGVYRGVLNNESGCTDTTNTFDFRVTPVSEHNTEESFELFPNPAVSSLNLRISDFKTTDGGISILNMMGANVYRQEKLVVSKGDNLNIPVASLPPGMYIIRLEDGNQFYTKKFIKN